MSNFKNNLKEMTVFLEPSTGLRKEIAAKISRNAYIKNTLATRLRNSL